jgi:phage baseplate assembly protein W
MAVERTSKPFKDISLSFVRNPATDDVTTLSNERAIARSIRNLVSTLRGERFFQPDLGCDVNNLLFENYLDLNSINVLEDEIRQTIEQYEPRVELDSDSVSVIAEPDNNEIAVKINFRIIGIEAQTQTLEFIFQPLR